MTIFARRCLFAGTALAILVTGLAAGTEGATDGPLAVSAVPTRFEDAHGRTVWLTGMMICCQGAQANGWPWISKPMVTRLAGEGGNWVNVRLGPFTRTGELPRFEAYRLVSGTQYDLDRWNDAFWTDLRDTVTHARDRGVYVEIDLIDGWVLENPPPPEPDRHFFSPWKAGSNVNGIADDCSILHGSPAPHHVRWLEKVVETIGDLDNVIFQVGNETSDCEGGGSSVAWEDGVIQVVRQALRAAGQGERLFSTNSESAAIEGLPSVDYVNLHKPWAVNIRAGKPTGVNEYAEDAFDANGYTRELWSAFTNGTYFHYWRGDDNTATFDTVVLRLGHFRRFLARTGLARYEAEPLGFRVVGAYAREYVGFLPNEGSREIDLGPVERTFRVDWYDPRSGVLTLGGTVTASGPYVFESPAGGAMRAVHVFAQDGCGDCTPSFLTANVDGYQVTLNWETDYVGIRRFRVERRLEPNGAWDDIAVNIPAHVHSQGDVLPAPDPSAAYSYRVQSLYLEGGFGYSNEVRVVIHNAPPPSPPAGLTPTGCAALPPHFRWDEAPLATGYYLRASTVAGNVPLLDNSSIDSTSYVPAAAGELALLQAHVGEAVAWSVKACNNIGCSDWATDAAVTLRQSARADFGGDCLPDMLLRSRTTGDLQAWHLDGHVRIGEGRLTPSKPAAGNWVLAGTADFDDDGKADLLWWNANSGNLALWLMDGSVRTSGVALAGIADLRWRVAATGDLNGDRRADILWRRTDTGELVAWLMTDGFVPNVKPLSPSSAPTAWELAALGDLTGDGRTDLLWRHLTTGELRYWTMNGTVQTGEGPIASSGTPNLGWKIVGIWNVDQDRYPDVVWQNQTSSRLVVWYMTGTAQREGQFFVPDQTGLDLESVGPR